MRRSGGYSIVTGPDLRQPEEADTFTCLHCNKVVHCIDQRTKRKVDAYDVGGLCYSCNGLICSACVGKECSPLMKRVEAMEARASMLKAISGG